MDDPDILPLPTFAGGTRAITLTPVVGTPKRAYADDYIPGTEPLEDGELRVTILGSGNPWVTRAQASGSVMVRGWQSRTRYPWCLTSAPAALPILQA